MLNIPAVEATLFLAYIFVFIFAVAAFGYWQRKRRGERPPLEFKLLRSPGETLRRNAAAMEESLILRAVLAALIPLVSAYSVLWLLAKLTPTISLWIGLTIIGVAFVSTSILSGWWFLALVNQRRRYALGYMGERAVGEALQPLSAEHYLIFHDVPAVAAERKFNLDHVVVGPTGLFLVETKTRSKRRARPGFPDHVVSYDGDKLIWPWGDDRHGLEQAAAEARWLSELIERLTGIRISVKPILALPGWYVKATARGAVNVVNHKGLVSAIKGRGVKELEPAHIDLIARQLDALCRDVTD